MLTYRQGKTLGNSLIVLFNHRSCQNIILLPFFFLIGSIKEISLIVAKSCIKEQSPEEGE